MKRGLSHLLYGMTFCGFFLFAVVTGITMWEHWPAFSILAVIFATNASFDLVEDWRSGELYLEAIWRGTEPR